MTNKALVLSAMAAVFLVGCMIPGTYYDPSNPYMIGLRWYDRGRYDYALQYWRPLLEKGDCDVQFHYGVMVFQGQGVTQNVEEAVAWWEKAADQGQPKAQMFLGDIFFQNTNCLVHCGDCKEKKDLLTAYKWYLLAGKSIAYSGEKQYLDHILPFIRAEMTPDEMTSVESTIADWKPTIVARERRKLL